MNRETLKENFDRVKQLTKKSHVMQFGDVTIASEGLSEFFAAAQQNGSYTSSLRQTILSNNVDDNNQSVIASAENEEDYDSISRAVIESSSTVSSRDSKLHSLLSNVTLLNFNQSPFSFSTIFSLLPISAVTHFAQSTCFPSIAPQRTSDIISSLLNNKPEIASSDFN